MFSAKTLEIDMAQTPLIPATWQINDVFRLRLGRSVGRQRLMQHEGELLIVAHEVPEPQSSVRRGILFWLDSDRKWHASNGDKGDIAIELLVQRYSRRLEEIDQLEASARNADEYLPLLESLAPISRAVRNLYDVLQEARKSVSTSVELIEARNEAYDVSRTAELLYQDAKNSMEVAVVRRAEQQAVSSNQMAAASHRLNMMAALFFPLATLGGVFGTTLTDNWTWSETPAPFLLFLVVGTIAGLVLALFVNRKVTM